MLFFFLKWFSYDVCNFKKMLFRHVFADLYICKNVSHHFSEALLALRPQSGGCRLVLVGGRSLRLGAAGGLLCLPSGS